MATVGPVSVFTVTMASGSTFSSAIDLSGSWAKTALRVPTMTSGTDVRLQVSDTIDGVFSALYHAPTAATAAPTVVNIPSSVSNCVVPIVIPARYVRVELTTITTSSINVFKVYGSAN
jgi:hypothetical protein